jgi:hypothetical protein
MKAEFWETFREWVRDEIEYAIESHEVDDSGYRRSASNERDEANKTFALFRSVADKELLSITGIVNLIYGAMKGR